MACPPRLNAQHVDRYALGKEPLTSNVAEAGFIHTLDELAAPPIAANAYPPMTAHVTGHRGPATPGHQWPSARNPSNLTGHPGHRPPGHFQRHRPPATEVDPRPLTR
jgi:hypothetical protein